jgi:hypothetical protein
MNQLPLIHHFDHGTKVHKGRNGQKKNKVEEEEILTNSIH